MKTSVEETLRIVTIYYENINNLLSGFQQATNAGNSDVIVKIKNIDGTEQEVTINSFSKIQSELTRLNNNYESITNADNLVYEVDFNGNINQITKTSFINAEYLTNFKFGVDQSNNTEDALCVVDEKSLIKEMIFPNVKIPIYLDKVLVSDIRCIIYYINSGFENIKENIKQVELDYLVSTNEIILGSKEELVLVQEKERVQYFGSFGITNVSINGNDFKVYLNKVNYTSKNSLDDSQILKKGDFLVNKRGDSKFEVIEIDKFTLFVHLRRIGGSSSLKVGTEELYFNEKLPLDRNIVGIPVQPRTKMVVFLSSENFKNIGFPSDGIKIDTSTYKVQQDDQNLTLDEFFDKYVINFGSYITTLIKDVTIPLSLGIQPAIPVLDDANFKIVQINKHITNEKTSEEIEKKNKNIQKIKNDIEYKQTNIDTVQNEIDTLKFTSEEEKNYRINQIQKFKTEINTLKINLLNASRDLDNNAIEYGLKNNKPKYRCLGFWSIQEPIFSPNTKAQHVIKYEVQYRYLSKNIDTVQNTSIKMIDNGREVNIVFSAWNDLPTAVLTKQISADGNYYWEDYNQTSIDKIKINQCAIPINDGESIEIRIRAVTEAGYPLNGMKSEWSNILRKDFPTELGTSSLSALVTKNENELRSAEFNDILQKSGILDHTSGLVIEGNRKFYHKASEIHSGQYTNEQKIIPVDVAIQNLINEINIIKNQAKENNLLIQIEDFKKEIFTVTNNSTIQLSGGNYSDNINLFDTEKFGSIIRKQGYIKISNQSETPIEIKTLIPGSEFNNTIAPTYYNVPVKQPNGLQQLSKQILFFRNVDNSGQAEDIFKLVKPKLPLVDAFPNITYIDTNVVEDQKNIVYLNDNIENDIRLCKLKENAGTDFVAFTKEHPLYDSTNLSALNNEFLRLRNYSKTLKAKQYQNETTGNDTIIGFADNDFYAIGETSCGAWLYPVITNPNAIQVIGNNTISTLILAGKSEILIPFVFEYRMRDRLGNVDGGKTLTINDELEYSKKIGIDLIINNNQFKFDIEVSSKLKSAVTPIEALNVTSVVAKLVKEDKEKLT